MKPPRTCVEKLIAEDLSGGERIDISLLGGFEVRVGSSRLQLPTRKAQALLAYLALTPGKPHGRERIHALLWPGSGKAQAQASLRQALLTLRKALLPCSPSALRPSDTTLALDALQVRVDVETLERCVADPNLEALERVMSACSGPFLDGFAVGEPSFDEWVALERARLQELVVSGLEKLAALQADAGQFDRAIQTTLHSLRLEPLDERAHRTLMRLYATHGRGAEAALHPPASTAVAPRGPIVALRRRPIVGREAEMTQLDGTLAEAWTGSGRLVVLRGDAGVGKTRLLEAAAARAVERGGRSMRGRCFESEQVLPFALWVDLVRSEPALADEALRQMPPAWRDEVSRILPPGGDVAVPSARPPNDARPLFEAVGELLTRIADRAPLLVLLEDLHWADAMSLRLLSFFARRVGPSSRVGLMATVRAEEMAGSTLLRTVLQEIAREQRLLEVSVGPLSRGDTLALLHSLAEPSPQPISPAAFEQVWAISEGNPLVVVETLRGLEQGAIAPSVARLPVPLRVRELIASHVARLDRFGHEVLATAAAIGRQFDFTLLLRVSGSSDRALAATIEDLVLARFLQGSGDGFYFTHDRIREVVYESLLPPHRKVLHGSIARALEALCADRLDDASGTIGYHFARAGEAAESVRYLLRFATQSTRSCGLEEALAALEEAQRQSATLPASCRDAAVVETAIRRAACLLFLGRITEMEPTLAPHRATLERLNAPSLATSFHALTAFAHASGGDRRRTEENDTRLLAVAEWSQDGPTAGLARSQLSYDAMRTGQFQRGIADGVEAVAKLESGDDPETTAFAWINLGGNYLAAGDCRRALEAFSRAAAIAQRTGSARVHAMGSAFMGLITTVCLGEIASGLAACRGAVGIAPDPYSAFHSHWSLVRASSAAARPPVNAHPPVLDDAFRASMAALDAYAGVSHGGLPQTGSGFAMVALSEGHLAMKNEERARAYALRALDALPPEGDPLAHGWALRVLGMAEFALGHLDASRDRLREARALFESIGARLEAAVAVFALAETANAQRDAVAAAGYLGEAYRRFDALALPFWTARVAQIAVEHAIVI